METVLFWGWMGLGLRVDLQILVEARNGDVIVDVALFTKLTLHHVLDFYNRLEMFLKKCCASKLWPKRTCNANYGCIVRARGFKRSCHMSMPYLFF